MYHLVHHSSYLGSRVAPSAATCTAMPHGLPMSWRAATHVLPSLTRLWWRSNRAGGVRAGVPVASNLHNDRSLATHVPDDVVALEDYTSIRHAIDQCTPACTMAMVDRWQYAE